MSPEDAELIRDYRVTFTSPSGQRVLTDLMRASHFRVKLPDDNLQIAEGERRLFLRILQFTELTDEQIFRLIAGQPIPTGEEPND